MAANTSPIFVLTPNVGVATFSAANTAKDGSGAINTVLTPGANGSRVEEIVVKGVTTFASSVVCIFLKVGGSTWFLFDEFVPGTGVGSTTASTFREAHTYRNLVVPSGCLVGATITVTPTTGNCQVFAFGGDY